MTNPSAHLVPIVIEQSGRGERGVMDEMANLIVAQLLFLANEDAKSDIHLYVNSPGGSVTAGLGIVDTMNFIKPDICTYVIGQAASMGSVIACSGAKGKRYALKNARNLMHQPLLSGVMEGQATDLEIEAKEMLRLRDRLYRIYSDATGQDQDKIKHDCDRNLWLDDQEMIKYGLIDSVLESMPVSGE